MVHFVESGCLAQGAFGLMSPTKNQGFPKMCQAVRSFLGIYRQYAKIYTDCWDAYEWVTSSKRHCPVDKDSGLTSYIERFNITLRQRVSRLVRKTLSFLNKLENHVGAIYLIYDHNRFKVYMASLFTVFIKYSSS